LNLIKIYLTLALLLISVGLAQAASVGEYTPGQADIRDYFVPESGLYFYLDNSYYPSSTLKDNNGNNVTSVTIFPKNGPPVTVLLNGHANSYSLTPTFIGVIRQHVLGASYGAFISPTFANSSIGAVTNTPTRRGGGVDTSQFNVGDLYVQPLWLDWSFDHWDIAFAYGFYAPTGKYNINTVTFPNVGVQVRAPAVDNIGLGFWTQQFQVAGAWYPWDSQSTAVTLAVTGEFHSRTRGFDLTTGADLTLEWGISQYISLGKSGNYQLEVGPSGYSQWQITDDTGSDATNGNLHARVYGAGAQLGFNYDPWGLSVTARYLHDFGARNRVQGQLFDLSMGFKFWSGGKPPSETQPTH